jgi:uncharacterized protein YqgC (DUF456 family)
MPGILRKVIGGILVVIGLVALFTPLTPGSWLIFVGAEMIGFKLLLWKRVKRWLDQYRSDKRSL